VLYDYFVAALDSTLHQSALSDPAFGQLASHDNGIIIVDATMDGGGGPFQPTDQQVDEYYDTILNGYNVNGHWDTIDSNSVGRTLVDAHLAPYSTVLLHCDRLSNRLDQDTTVLRRYLENGGRLIISGWNLSYTFAYNRNDFVRFAPGSFFRELLKVDSLGVSPNSTYDFISAPSLLPSLYPDLIVDSIKVSMFDHLLFRMEAFLGPLVDEPLTQPLNCYESTLGDQSPLNGEPVALRYLGDFRLVFFDVPLYFMTQESATPALHQALFDIGEMPVAIDHDNPPNRPVEYGLLGNYPNPFNSSTIIEYRLPTMSDVSIDIYDILGRKITTLINTTQPAGDHSVLWSADGFPSGIYFCKIRYGQITQTTRMLLLR
jgi:hypothetical protein